MHVLVGRAAILCLNNEALVRYGIPLIVDLVFTNAGVAAHCEAATRNKGRSGSRGCLRFYGRARPKPIAIICGCREPQNKDIVTVVCALRLPVVVKGKERREAVMHRNTELLGLVRRYRVPREDGVAGTSKVAKECGTPLAPMKLGFIRVLDKERSRSRVAE